MEKGKLAIVASLFNGKKVLLEPNHAQKKCAYRYLTDTEVEEVKLDLSKKYIWHETPIHSTVEEGETLVFATIDVTPIVLNRL